MNRYTTITIFAAFFAIACSGGEADPCISDEDCFSGEVCRADGFCGAPQPDDDGGADDGGGTAGDASNVHTVEMGPDDTSDASMNNESTDMDDQNTNDSGDAGNDDVSASEEMGSMGPCIVDPFVQCTDDEDSDNNSFPGETVVPETKGCQSAGFEPMDVTISGKMCALDPEDLYRFNIVECDDDEPGFVIEATLDIEQSCDPDLIWFDVEGIGTSCADPDPEDDQTLRCETLPDGRRKISIIWPGQSNPVVGSVRFSIQTPDRMDVEFDYDLHLVLREP